jgi:DNA-directed RNA polymerase specialized sigma24 family protein
MPSTTGNFAATRWTLVLRAKVRDATGQKALSELCEAYYAPVVAFLRYRGQPEDAAREQAHDFFARVLGGGALSGADPQRGRFRSYLLGALKHFLADEHDRAQAMKRGGGVETVPLETGTKCEIPSPQADETVFDRHWALTLIARALDTLGTEARGQQKQEQFEVFKPWLSGTGDNLQPIADAAAKLGMSEGAAKVAIHRLRSRFRELVKEEIAQTVPAETDIDDELRHLVAVLTRSA